MSASAIGYLEVLGSTIALRVVCQKCRRWRSHGAGTPDLPLEVAGTETYRVPHCPREGGEHYYTIHISEVPFDPAWMKYTPTGPTITPAYTKFLETRWVARTIEATEKERAK